MNWKKLNKSASEEQLNSFFMNRRIECEGPYSQLRDDFLAVFNDTLSLLNIDRNEIQNKVYLFDLHFGIKIYSLLTDKYQFTPRQASEDGIWRFLSINVVPDLVNIRWGDNPSRYWKEPRRIWLKSLWWYIFLSWQGSIESTIEVLEGNTTDEIVQLVERSGRSGYRVELYRQIMRHYSTLDAEKRKRSTDIFRKIMKLNTARTRVVEPSLSAGGVTEYVKELFLYFDRKK